jgi:serine/threonine protein kinase
MSQPEADGESSAKPDAVTVVGSGSAVPDDATLLLPEAAPTTPGTASVPRRRLGVYRLERLVARGGMGAVWEAVDTRLDRKVAVKVLLPGFEARPEYIERFRREALHSARLRHANIVTVHDVGEDGGRHYLVMDLVEGITLAELLRRQNPTYREKVALLEKIARAVDYAHSQGIVHRDLKPTNIMLERRGDGSHAHRSRGGDADEPSTSLFGSTPGSDHALGEPLVMDFGLAFDAERDSSLSVAGRAIGTPSYMPPEQATGRHERIGRHSDVYSLGAILYELLTGRPPFTGESMVQILQAVCRDEPVRPSRLARDAPADLQTICLKCLEKQPGRRYRSAALLADDLRAWLDGDAIAARPASRLELVVKRLRKNPTAFAVGTLAVLALIVITTSFMVLLDGRRREAESALARFRAESAAHQVAESARAELAVQRERAWSLVFSDDFTDPAVERRWQLAGDGARWTVEDGALHITGGGARVAFLRQPAFGDLRLEFDCRLAGENLCDVSCILAARRRDGLAGMNDGYQFKYGGFANTRVALLRDGEILSTRPESPLRADHAYHVVAERVGDALRLTVDGAVVIDARDAAPLLGQERDRIGLFGYRCDAFYDNVRLWRLGEAPATDLLAMAQRFLGEGRLATARDLFAEIASGAGDEERRAAAAQGLEECTRRLAWQAQAPALQGRLRARWPTALVSVRSDGLDVRLGHGEGDLALLRGQPIARLDCGGLGFSSLEPLRGLRLVELACQANRIADLAPLAGMPLRSLQMGDNAITDLAPLHGAPLTDLAFPRNAVASLEPLRGMPLERLDCSANPLTGLAPLTGLPLTRLYMSKVGAERLDELAGLRLTSLMCDGNRIASLEPLHGMPLDSLACDENRIASLEPLRGMSLVSLRISRNQVADLAPLRGMSLSSLLCDRNHIADLEPLRGMPITAMSVECNDFTSFGPLLDAPPGLALSFWWPGLPEAALERAVVAWDATNPALAAAVRQVLALERSDPRLRAQASRADGSGALVVPMRIDRATALRWAEGLGARLPDPTRGDQLPEAPLPTWTGLAWHGGRVLRADGTPAPGSFGPAQPDGWAAVGSFGNALGWRDPSLVDGYLVMLIWDAPSTSLKSSSLLP